MERRGTNRRRKGVEVRVVTTAPGELNYDSKKGDVDCELRDCRIEDRVYHR